MIRTLLFSNDGQNIKTERAYRDIKDWDLENAMKLWLEFPERTRFARYPFDILYTPIFFGNEVIGGDICLEATDATDGGTEDEVDRLTVKVSLKGTASLGILNAGGRPASIYDTRYAFSMVGFRPIITIPVLNESDTYNMTGGQYEQNGLPGRKVPFSFPLRTQTLNQLRELTPSMKLISSDTETTLEILKGHCPTMLLNVRYVLEAILFDGDVRKQKIEQEVRVWVSLDADQCPSPLPEISDTVTQHRRSSLVPLKRTRSLPFTSARRKSVHEGGNHLIIEAENHEPFAFTPNNDAAATKLQLTITYATGEAQDELPGRVEADVQWLVKSLSTMAVQPNNREPDEDGNMEDYFHLRTRHLPVKKLKLSWSDWRKPDDDEGLRSAWRSTQDLWLTLSTTAGLTPTFRTSFISHSYSLWIQLNLSGKGLKGRSYKVELNVPTKLRYDVGLAPSYTVDQGLPGYEVDEGQGTQQPGPGIDYPEPPPPHEDADSHIHRSYVPRYTPDELADLIRTTGLRESEPADEREEEDPPLAIVSDRPNS